MPLVCHMLEIYRTIGHGLRKVGQAIAYLAVLGSLYRGPVPDSTSTATEQVWCINGRLHLVLPGGSGLL
jgi:hypothetical protein